MLAYLREALSLKRLLRARAASLRLMFAGQQQVSFTQYVQQHGQPLPMGNWTEDARGSLPAAYGQQFEFTIASGGQAVVLRATSYLQRGSYGAAFTVRTVQAGGGALGETWCAKFFTVRDADAVKEFDRLEQIHAWLLSE